MSTEERKNYYLKMRKEFNDMKKNNSANEVERAAHMIFLNKTCFNGLYRVNRKGEFNVPMGAYKNPLICDENNLRNISEKLSRVEMVCGDYRESEKYIDSNTFVYFDPPYRPLTETSSFTSYTEDMFTDDNQRQLAEYVQDLCRKGAKVVVSNSDPKNINPEDDFFDDLYSAQFIKRIEATRMINSKASGRGKIKELLISNF
jgi:DNA adenine methylase